MKFTIKLVIYLIMKLVQVGSGNFVKTNPKMFLTPADFPRSFVFNEDRPEKILFNEIKLLENDLMVVGVVNKFYVFLKDDFVLPSSSQLINQTVVWNNSDVCLKPNTFENAPAKSCQNHIKILSLISPNQLLVCAIIVGKSSCRVYMISDENEITENYYDLKMNISLLPNSPDEYFSYVLSNGNLYLAVRGNNNHALTRQQLTLRNLENVQLNPVALTNQNSPGYFDDPHFTSTPVEYGDKVYFFVRETAFESNSWLHYDASLTEQSYFKEEIFSRVLQVCKADPVTNGTWQTFLKARLVCPFPTPLRPILFDRLQSNTPLLNVFDRKVFFAAFTAYSEGPNASAICMYDWFDVLEAFRGPTYHQIHRCSGPSYPCGWNVRPSGHACNITDSGRIKNASEDRFASRHIDPVGMRPLFTTMDANHQFSALAVDSNVEIDDVTVPIVLYIGTTTGKVFRVFIQNVTYRRDFRDSFNWTTLFDAEIKVFLPQRCQKHSFNPDEKIVRKLLVIDGSLIIALKHCIITLSSNNVALTPEEIQVIIEVGSSAVSIILVSAAIIVCYQYSDRIKLQMENIKNSFFPTRDKNSLSSNRERKSKYSLYKQKTVNFDDEASIISGNTYLEVSSNDMVEEVEANEETNMEQFEILYY